MNPESPFSSGPQPSQYGPQPTVQPQQQPYGQQATSLGVEPTPLPQPQQPYQPIAQQPMQKVPTYSGGSKVWMIVGIVAIATTLIATGLGIWAFVNYLDQKDNVDSKVTSAVATAVKSEQDKAAEHLLEVENNPNRLFSGPDDYGHLTFNYSKLWSIYVDKDASSGGTYSAYLNPVSVPPVSNTERYALRVTIEDKDYDKVISSYQSLVSRGDLKSSTFKLDDETSGTRLDGNFTKDIRGSAVIFKIRDKTVTLRSDATTFKKQFDALIKTIQFNK